MFTRLMASVAGLLIAPPAFAAPPDFDRDVVPILASRCLDCHTGEDGKGGVDLARHSSVVGPQRSVVPGRPDQSLLWKKVVANEMPPKKPLPEKEKAILKDWIAGGAKWCTDPVDPFAITTGSRAGRN